MSKEYYINTQYEVEKNFPKKTTSGSEKEGVYFTGYQRIIGEYLWHCLFNILVATFMLLSPSKYLAQRNNALYIMMNDEKLS